MPHSFTHAGGVVFRTAGDKREFLLVTARQRPDQWVLPKGHIEPEETPEAAAVREIHEEAGIDAVIRGALKDVSLLVRGERQRIRFYLLEARREALASEGRRLAWLGPEEAIRRLSFPESKEVVREAVAALSASEAKE